MKDKPNWKKGDIVVLIGPNGGALHIFEAEYDPHYGNDLWGRKDWYYGLRLCEEIRLATKDDVEKKINFQKERVELEQSRLDELFNFRETLGKSSKVVS